MALTQKINKQKQKQTSFVDAFMACMCPCLQKKKKKREKDYLEGLLVDNQTQMDVINDADQKFENQKYKKNEDVQAKSVKLMKGDNDVQSYFGNTAKGQNQIHKYVSVRRYEQDRLILFGLEDRVAMRFSSKNLKLSQLAIDKTKLTLQKLKDKPQTYPNIQIQNCWKKRYILFSKFDQGVKFDQQSYISTPPQALTTHLASRIRCNKLIHAFAGIGAYDIKLCNTCQTIIVTDIPTQTKQCLQNNLSIYQVDDVQIANINFLELTNTKSDSILITPPWGINYSINQQHDISHFQINKLFSKALQISSNVVLVLPSNINIAELAQNLGKSLHNNKNKNSTSSFSFEIQKIFVLDRLRFIVVYYGTLVGRQVKLSDQLDIIYDLIGNSTLKCRKISKYIRQQYGLPFLLRLCSRAEFQLKTNTFDKFIQIIQKQKIIPDAKLKSFLNKSTNPVITKIDDSSEQQSPIRQSIKTNTNSYVSEYDIGNTNCLDHTRKTIIVQASQSIKTTSAISLAETKKF